MDREKIVKMVVALAAVIVIAVSLGKLFGRNSMSLSEYARLNGGETLSQAPSHGQEGSEEDSNGEDSPESTPASPSLSGDPEDIFVSSLTGAALNGDSQLEQRVTLEDGFYYEPISDSLRRYMTGISFPAENSRAEASSAGGETLSSEESVPSPKDSMGKNPGTADSPEENAESSSKENAAQISSPEKGSASPAQKDADELSLPEITFDDLRYVHILHIDFNGNPTEGELICNKLIAADLAEIFQELYRNEYRLEKVLLMEEYDGDDNASMEDNNTSCFNYRTVDDTDRLSKHAYGLAIDVNPLYNPYITYTEEGDEQVSPASALPYADRSLNFPYKITEDDLCYRLFTQHGFIWGGNWNNVKDYQHFQKNLTQGR